MFTVILQCQSRVECVTPCDVQVRPRRNCCLLWNGFWEADIGGRKVLPTLWSSVASRIRRANSHFDEHTRATLYPARPARVERNWAQVVACSVRLDIRYDGSVLTRTAPSYQAVVDRIANTVVRKSCRGTDVLITTRECINEVI